mmetsp:Transcript_11571/g.16080  ORF Transcript_11571/g.16080 Transcript_11571/m.16080 type:complete len:320 (+) Transcript_11571:42-1001(+)
MPFSTSLEMPPISKNMPISRPDSERNRSTFVDTSPDQRPGHFRCVSPSIPVKRTAPSVDNEIDQITSRLKNVCVSPSELLGPFVGSFQESLLSGHMSNTPSTVYHGFMADLGVSSKKMIPPHLKMPFSAIYYHIDYETPYVGTLELDKKGYQIPQKGTIQLTVINPSKTPMKTFLVKYDLEDMPPGTKTFLRQKITAGSPGVLRYAIHLKFVCPKKKKYYLYNNIRIAFAHRVDDMEVLNQSYDMPDAPKYFPYTPRRRSLSESNGCESLSDSSCSIGTSLSESGSLSLTESIELNNNHSEEHPPTNLEDLDSDLCISF